VIVRVQGSGGDAKLTVAFPNQGLKELWHSMLPYKEPDRRRDKRRLAVSGFVTRVLTYTESTLRPSYLAFLAIFVLTAPASLR
jgi:hypothetical protein